MSQTGMNTRTYFRVDEAAKILCLHKSTVYRQINRGDLEAYRIGGSLRIPVSEVINPKKKRVRRKKSRK